MLTKIKKMKLMLIRLFKFFYVLHDYPYKENNESIAFIVSINALFLNLPLCLFPISFLFVVAFYLMAYIFCLIIFTCVNWLLGFSSMYTFTSKFDQYDVLIACLYISF